MLNPNRLVPISSMSLIPYLNQHKANEGNLTQANVSPLPTVFNNTGSVLQYPLQRPSVSVNSNGNVQNTVTQSSIQSVQVPTQASPDNLEAKVDGLKPEGQ